MKHNAVRKEDCICKGSGRKYQRHQKGIIYPYIKEEIASNVRF